MKHATSNGRYRKGNTFGNQNNKLVMPYRVQSQKIVAKTWHNPYTEKMKSEQKRNVSNEKAFSPTTTLERQ